jgi:hypothetical protein
MANYFVPSATSLTVTEDDGGLHIVFVQIERAKNKGKERSHCNAQLML